MPMKVPMSAQRIVSHQWRKHVLHALQRAVADAPAGRVAGDRGAAHHEVDDLRDGEEAHQHRHQIEPLPEIERVEREARDAGLRILADHRQEKPETAGEKAAQHAARALRRRARR